MQVTKPEPKDARKTSHFSYSTTTPISKASTNIKTNHMEQ